MARAMQEVSQLQQSLQDTQTKLSNSETLVQKSHAQFQERQRMAGGAAAEEEGKRKLQSSREEIVAFKGQLHDAKAELERLRAALAAEKREHKAHVQATQKKLALIQNQKSSDEIMAIIQGRD